MKLKYNNRQFQSKLNQFMQTRNNKPKKSSKLKHTVTTCYNSPSKVSISTGLSSGCCPKQPPNISQHHLQKKRQQIRAEYLIGGKQNKGRIMNHVAERDNTSILQTERLKEKRNTHNQITYQMISHNTQNSKLLDPKRNTHNYTKATNNFTLNSSKLQHNYPNEPKYHFPDPGHKYTNFHEVNKLMNESKYFHQTQQNRNLKTVSKKKLVIRQPIALKPMKNNKNRFVRQNDYKQSARNDKNQKDRPVKKEFKLRPSVIGENEQSCYQCFQTISTYSITHSKHSTAAMNLNDLAADQQLIIVKPENPLNRSKKPTFHKSPKILSPSASIKVIKTPEQELAEFETQITEINTNFQQDSLNYMLNKDFQYVQSKNLNCYLGNQLYFDWKKRATVVSWMIQVLSQIGGKRQTLANAVNVFDRYLSLTHNIPLKQMQCIAAASLLIAAKLQDKSLSAQYLSQATQQLYSQQQIMSEEFKILETLQWNVNTPTLNCWANRLALQWDVYLDRKDLRHFDIILNNLNDIKFKNTEQKSYYNYRMLCQYVDFSIMDICTLRYQPRLISLAFIYIILLIRLNLYDKDLVATKFPTSSQFLLEKSTFNEFFSDFLRDSFSQQLEDLLPMIQYCATFVILHLNFQMPQVINQMESQDQQLHYEQFCSYQTKNQHMLQTLYQRNRDIY